MLDSNACTKRLFGVGETDEKFINVYSTSTLFLIFWLQLHGK
jgi:hypothetical protein